MKPTQRTSSRRGLTGAALTGLALLASACGTSPDETFASGDSTESEAEVAGATTEATSTSSVDVDVDVDTDDEPAGDTAAPTTLPPATTSATPATTAPETTAAAGLSSTSTSTTTTTAGGDVSASGDPIVGAGPIDQGLWPFIDIAVADLSGRLSLALSDITVNRAILTTWANGALGCPDPKMVYTQVASDGSVIELGAAGATWWYHSGGTQGPFLCESVLRTPVN